MEQAKQLGQWALKNPGKALKRGAYAAGTVTIVGLLAAAWYEDRKCDRSPACVEERENRQASIEEQKALRAAKSELRNDALARVDALAKQFEGISSREVNGVTTSISGPHTVKSDNGVRTTFLHLNSGTTDSGLVSQEIYDPELFKLFEKIATDQACGIAKDQLGFDPAMANSDLVKPRYNDFMEGVAANQEAAATLHGTYCIK